MNTIILIFTLLLFAIAVAFALLYFHEIQNRKQKNENLVLRRRIKQLTKRLKLIENKGNWSEVPKEAKSKTPNAFENMERRTVQQLKQAVAVNGEEIKIQEAT